MVNLFDIMRGSQGGSGIDNLARQYGLTVAETQRAVEAFLPAFSLGLRGSTRRPDAFAQVLDMMSSGRFAPFYDAPALGGVGAAAGGQEVLRQLFGDPEASARIARQVSAMTGITTQVLQGMMPAIAGMLMGGLFRFATVEGMADVLGHWADWLRSVKPAGQLPAAPPARDGTADVYAAWGDFVGAVFGQPRPAPPAPPAATDPWSAMVSAMAGAGARPAPALPPSRDANPFAVLSQMFEVGRDVQAGHMAAFHALVDRMWEPAMRRP